MPGSPRRSLNALLFFRYPSHTPEHARTDTHARSSTHTKQADATCVTMPLPASISSFYHSGGTSFPWRCPGQPPSPSYRGSSSAGVYGRTQRSRGTQQPPPPRSPSLPDISRKAEAMHSRARVHSSSPPSLPAVPAPPPDLAAAAGSDSSMRGARSHRVLGGAGDTRPRSAGEGGRGGGG